MNLARLPDETLRRILRRLPKGLLPLYAEVCKRWKHLIDEWLNQEGWPSQIEAYNSRYHSLSLCALATVRRRPLTHEEQARHAEGRLRLKYHYNSDQWGWMVVASRYNVPALEALQMVNFERRVQGRALSAREVDTLLATLDAQYMDATYLQPLYRLYSVSVDVPTWDLANLLRVGLFDPRVRLSWLLQMRALLSWIPKVTAADCARRERTSKNRPLSDLAAAMDVSGVGMEDRVAIALGADDPTQLEVLDPKHFVKAAMHPELRVFRAILAKHVDALPFHAFEDIMVRCGDSYHPLGPTPVVSALLEAGVPMGPGTVPANRIFASWADMWCWLDAFPRRRDDVARLAQSAAIWFLSAVRHQPPTLADVQRYAALGCTLTLAQVQYATEISTTCANGVAEWLLAQPQTLAIINQAVASLDAQALQIKRIELRHHRKYPAHVNAMRARFAALF